MTVTNDRPFVNLGDKQVQINVTEANASKIQSMVADGDLTNDLQKIAGMDGDASTITKEDFTKAGFDVRDVNVLTKLSQTIPKINLSDATLGSSKTDFANTVASKPYLQVGGKSPTLAQLHSSLQTMTTTGRNGILSELATETAMLKVGKAAITTMGADLANRCAQITNDQSGNFAQATQRQLQGMPGGASAANKTKLKEAILAYPDMPIGAKHAALQQLGMTSIADRNTAITTARGNALKQVRTEAETLFKTMGGIGDMGETHSLATGDGSGTKGLAAATGQANLGIGYMAYADAKQGNGNTITGLSTNTLSFTPKNLTQPVPIHLSATGADFDIKSKVTVARGNQTISFDVSKVGNNTALSLSSKLPDGVKYDEKTQTLTFPPGDKPISVTQSSAGDPGDRTNFDEIQVSVTAFNASTGKPSLAIDFGKLFTPDRFAIDWNTVPADQQAQVQQYAKYLAENPDQKLTLDIKGKGPTDFDGSPMKEIGGYGKEGSGTSREEFALLRSATLDVDANNGTGTIIATTDPTVSGLSSKVGQQGGPAVVSFMKTVNDARVKKNEAPLTQNDVLAGMRAYAIKELLEQAVVQAGGKADQIQIQSSTIDVGTPFTQANYDKIANDTQVLVNFPKPVQVATQPK